MQARAARAILQWQVLELAQRAGVSKPTILNLEHGRPVHRASALAVRTALEQAGIELLGEDGVRFVERVEAAARDKNLDQ